MTKIDGWFHLLGKESFGFMNKYRELLANHSLVIVKTIGIDNTLVFVAKRFTISVPLFLATKQIDVLRSTTSSDSPINHENSPLVSQDVHSGTPLSWELTTTVVSPHVSVLRVWDEWSTSPESLSARPKKSVVRGWATSTRWTRSRWATRCRWTRSRRATRCRWAGGATRCRWTRSRWATR